MFQMRIMLLQLQLKLLYQFQSLLQKKEKNII